MNETSVNSNNFLPRSSSMPTEEGRISEPSMLAKQEINKELDSILQGVYRFADKYCLTFEQANGFLTRRYYQLHLHESTIQTELTIIASPQLDLEGKQLVNIEETYIPRKFQRQEVE